MYKITNSYHNTETTTKYNEQERANNRQGQSNSPKAQAMRRARNKLCGISGCTCGNDWGER